MKHELTNELQNKDLEIESLEAELKGMKETAKEEIDKLKEAAER